MRATQDTVGCRSIVKINPKDIRGAWRKGWALDLHTLSSIPRGDGEFDTTRSELGEALYQLKYRFDRSKIEPIAEVAARYIQNLLVFQYLKAIIAVPPSKLDRPFQPVLELARAISEKTGLPIPDDYLIKVKQTQALKNIEDAELRRQQMQGAFQVADQRYAKQYVLVFDDLFRSGETLNAVSNALTTQGGVERVFVLTVTMTRTKQ
jgi:competence protein ComFC